MRLFEEQPLSLENKEELQDPLGLAGWCHEWAVTYHRARIEEMELGNHLAWRCPTSHRWTGLAPPAQLVGQLGIEVEPHPPPGYTVMVLIDPRGKRDQIQTVWKDLFVLSSRNCVRIGTDMIPNWINQGCGHPLLCRKSWYSISLSFEPNWDGMHLISSLWFTELTSEFNWVLFSLGIYG